MGNINLIYKDEIASLDETVAKLGKERKHQEEVSEKIYSDLNLRQYLKFGQMTRE